MYECMYVRYEKVCHTISGLKMLHPEDPPPHLFEAQKTCGGGYISCGQVKYFSEISCLTPPKYSRVKGGGNDTILGGGSLVDPPANWGGPASMG